MATLKVGRPISAAGAQNRADKAALLATARAVGFTDWDEYQTALAAQRKEEAAKAAAKLTAPPKVSKAAAAKSRARSHRVDRTESDTRIFRCRRLLRHPRSD
jgi:type IV secretory pathway TrbL component